MHRRLFGRDAGTFRRGGRSGDIIKRPSHVGRATEPYSHSRLSTFEKCPYRYKLQYIDRLEVEEAVGIEAFTGTLVHESLEHLYARARDGEVVPWEELVARLRSRWDELLDDSVFVVRPGTTRHDHLFKAQGMLMSYYRRHRPFDGGTTVGLEHELNFRLNGEREHEFTGYIDRLSCLGRGVYEVHDYKTGKRLPAPRDLRQDRQLALYEIGVRRTFPDVREVRLVWHYLAHDKELRSSRTPAELEAVERDAAALIERIEACERFPRREGPLCRWCEYRGVCRDGAD